MQFESNFPTKTSTNSNKKQGLSNANMRPWSPTATDDEPLITVTVDDENAYIDSVSLTVDGVERVEVVVVYEDGSKGDPITEEPSGEEEVVITVDDSGVQLEITLIPSTPGSPNEITVSDLQVKACAEARCEHDIEESSWYSVQVNSNPLGKKGLRLKNADPWTPEDNGDLPTVKVIVGKGNNVWIESVRIPEAEGVASFSVQPMNTQRETVGPQLNGNQVGSTVTINQFASRVIITLFAGDSSDTISVGPIMTAACGNPVTAIVTEETTTDYKNVTASTPLVLTTTPQEQCVITFDDIEGFTAEEGEDLIGYVDKDGNSEYTEDEEVNNGDTIDDGVIVIIADKCHNCTCESGVVTCTEADTCERDCVKEEWSAWSECSAECGGGFKERTRGFIPGTPGGEPCGCEEDLKQREFCNEVACEVPGNWGSWEPWSDCSVTCGGGIKRRYRECNDPAPANGGEDCEGNAVDVEFCLADPCPGEQNKECGENKIWDSVCKKPFSCYDYVDEDALVMDDGCEEACICATGFVMDKDGECVRPTEECGCYDPLTGKEYIEGESGLRRPEDACEVCTCENAKLTCEEKDCNRDCDYTEWSEWSECSNIMGGEVKRYRSPNNPEARGNGKACDEDALVESRPCGDESCQHCIIDGVKYAVSEVIHYEACAKSCFCGQDGKMQCTSLEETCEECAEGYELSPTDRDCCRCVPVETECSLKESYQKVEVDYPTENGQTVKCATDGPVKISTCAGSCASMDSVTLMINGEVVNHEKDCRCCSGREYVEVDLPLTCEDEATRSVTMQRFKRCECNVCSGADGAVDDETRR